MHASRLLTPRGRQIRLLVIQQIFDILDHLPPAYTPEVYRQKCEVVYQHVYDSYTGPGQTIYRT